MTTEEVIVGMVKKIAEFNGAEGTVNFWMPYQCGNDSQNYRLKVSFEFPDNRARSWCHWVTGYSPLNLAQNFRDLFPSACRAAGMKLSPDSEPANCATCGNKQVVIRGRYPKDDKRTVCPVCMADKLDDLRAALNGPQTAKAAR